MFSHVVFKIVRALSVYTLHKSSRIHPKTTENKTESHTLESSMTFFTVNAQKRSRRVTTVAITALTSGQKQAT